MEYIVINLKNHIQYFHAEYWWKKSKKIYKTWRNLALFIDWTTQYNKEIPLSFPFSRGSPQPRDQTVLQADSLPAEPQGNPNKDINYPQIDTVPMHAQSCPTFCDLMDYGLPGSSGHGTFQTRILEWLPFPSPGDLPDPGNKPASFVSPALAVRFLTSWAMGKSIDTEFHTLSNKILPIKLLCRYRDYSKIYIERQTN